ncbi:MAG: Ada metal-binding domain-containing protein [Planctomycetota bacterium]|jgi:hypothetical protein
MKTKKYHLMLATVVIILCISVVGNTVLPAPAEHRVIGEPPEPGLIGQPHMALAGVQQMYVVIKPPDSEPNKDGLVWSELEKSVSDKIKEETGIKIVEDDIGKMSPDIAKLLKRRSISAAHLEFRSANIPELRVDIDMLKLQDSQQYVFHIQTSLATKVYLPRGRPWSLKADVWKALPIMQAISARNMAGKVTELVLKQVEAFILAHRVANSQLAQMPGADIAQKGVRKDTPKPPPRLLATKFNYVASKNSKVFHRPTCSSAARIAPKNLQGYGKRAGAIRAGKRPCKRCSP